MRNKLIILDAIQKAKEKDNVEITLDIIHSEVEQLSLAELKKVTNAIMLLDTTDVDVKLRRQQLVIEVVFNSDNTLDLLALTRSEYISRYGGERYE